MNLSKIDKERLRNLIFDAVTSKAWSEPRDYIVNRIQTRMIQQVQVAMSNDLELAIFMSLQTQVVAETVSDIIL